MIDMFTVSILLVSSLWAMSMGASGFAVSFATVYSTRKIDFWVCIILFTVSLGIGAILLGGEVAKTLSSGIIPQELLSSKKWLTVIILFSAGVSLLISNSLKVPSSTSIIIMSSFLGAGIFFANFKVLTFIYFILVSLGCLLLTYFITYFTMKFLYPPRYENLWFYEKVISKKNLMFLIPLVSSIYNAFSIGTNNVPNVVGPVAVSSIVDIKVGFIIFSLLFGLGAIIFGRGVLKTVSQEVVPIGIFSATIISVIASSFTIFASIIGLPFPIVLVIASAIIALSTVKREVSHLYSLKNPVVRKIFNVWIFSTFFPVFLSFLYCYVFSVLGLL